MTTKQSQIMQPPEYGAQIARRYVEEINESKAGESINISRLPKKIRMQASLIQKPIRPC